MLLKQVAELPFRRFGRAIPARRSSYAPGATRQSLPGGAAAASIVVIASSPLSDPLAALDRTAARTHRTGRPVARCDPPGSSTGGAVLHGNRDDTAPGPPSAPRDPEELEAGRGAAAAGEVSPRTTVGPVHLTVADLERSLAYIANDRPRRPRPSPDGPGSAPAGRLVVLVEEPGPPSEARDGPVPLALLLPTRVGLARWLAHAVRDRFTRRALRRLRERGDLLGDPDGHGSRSTGTGRESSGKGR